MTSLPILNPSARLDQILHGLQRQPSWNIWQFDESGKPVPWYPVGGAIVYEAAVRDADLQTQIEELPAKVAFWGRMAALCQRVLEWEERQYRVWKAERKLEIMQPPAKNEDKPGWSSTAKGEPKAPSQDVCESLYRTHKEYRVMHDRIDRAREALNATEAVLEAFRTKKHVIEKTVRRAFEDGQPHVRV